MKSGYPWEQCIPRGGLLGLRELQKITGPLLARLHPKVLSFWKYSGGIQVCKKLISLGSAEEGLPAIHNPNP